MRSSGAGWGAEPGRCLVTSQGLQVPLGLGHSMGHLLWGSPVVVAAPPPEGKLPGGFSGTWIFAL